MPGRVRRWVTMNRPYLRDLGERVAVVFLCAFAGQWFGAGLGFSTSVLRSATAAGLAAAVSFAKGAVAKKVGDPSSAGLLTRGRPGG